MKNKDQYNVNLPRLLAAIAAIIAVSFAAGFFTRAHAVMTPGAEATCIVMKYDCQAVIQGVRQTIVNSGYPCSQVTFLDIASLTPIAFSVSCAGDKHYSVTDTGSAFTVTTR